MKSILIFLATSLCGSLLFAGCAASGQPSVPTPVLPIPAPTEVRVWPTPSAPGDLATWQALQVRLASAEITDRFVTEFGAERVPSPGQKFLWVQIRLENTGENGLDLPAPEHFSALYAQSEFKPTYGHRQGHPDYTALSATLYPGQTVEAWLRFDIPIMAELQNLEFVFLPESAELGTSPSSPDYPWSGEHPIYVWRCAPR